MAQSAESALIVRMEATLRKFEAQMAKGQAVANRTAKGVEDRMAAMNRNVARNAEQAGEAIGRVGGRTMMIQNASFQLQDFAVQVASGTSASQALGQQLPQLLSGFGALGAVVGAAVAIGVPLAGMLIGSKDKATDLDTAIKGLTSASSDYRDAVDELLTPMGDMYAKFGQNAEAARQIQTIMLDIARIRLSDSIGKVGEGIDSELSGLQSLVEEYQTIGATDLKTPGLQYEAATQMAEIIADIREEYGMTYVEAERIARAIDQMNAALKSGDEQAKAAAFVEMSAALAGALDNGIGLTDEMKTLAENVATAASEQLALAANAQAAADAAGDVAGADMAGNIGAAADQGGRLAGNLGAAADAARFLAAQRSLATRGQVSSGRGGDPRTSSQQGYGEFGRDTLDEIIADERRRLQRDAGGGGRGGRGGKSAAKEDYASAVERLQQQIEAFNLESEAVSASADSHLKYGDAADYAKKKAELLIAAQKEGKAITPELSAKIEEQAAAYAEAAQKAEDARNKITVMQQQAARGRDALGDVFGAVLEGADAAKQALANLLMEIAKIQMQKAGLGAIDAAGGGGFVSWLGGLLSFDGGGYTGKGSRSGGLDGKGGFPALLHPNETVIDHSKAAASPQPQGLVITAHTDDSVILRVARTAARGEVQGATPSLVRQSVKATGRAMAATKRFGGRMV